MELFLQDCQAALTSHGGLVFTLFLGGLVGSLTHCIGMCGPFAFAQSAAGRSVSPNPGILARVQGAALMPYHFGRITTYVALGAAAAGFAGFFRASASFQTLASILFIGAGLLFLVSAVPALKWPLAPAGTQKTMQAFGTLLGRMAKPFFRSESALHRYGLGITLGFLPCGLVAAALLAVTATGNVLLASIAMAGFGLATVPALVGVAAVGQLSTRNWPIKMNSIARGVMLFNSASLFAIAGGLLS